MNNDLMPGPDLTNETIGALPQFLQERVASMADIEIVLYQVGIPPEQRSFLKFWWWKIMNTREDLIDLEMCSYVFSNTLSPSCSN